MTWVCKTIFFPDTWMNVSPALAVDQMVKHGRPIMLVDECDRPTATCPLTPVWSISAANGG